MNWFARRLSEPSTWAGLAAVVFGGSGLSGTPLSHLSPDLIVNLVVTVAGLVATVKPSPSLKPDDVKETAKTAHGKEA